MAVVSQRGAPHATDAEKAVVKSQPWLEPMARLGYAAKGFVYALIGVLAAFAAWHINIGQRSADMNQRGVLNFLARQWYGTVLLIAIAVGLTGYALWRLISASLNAEDQSTSKRLGYAASGLTYGYVAYVAVCEVLGSRANADERGLAWTLVKQPFGHVLLVIAGCVILAIAIAQLWNAITGKFQQVFKKNEMKPWQIKAVVWFGRIGFTARAVLFGVIAGFFFYAGFWHNANAAGGIIKALATMQHSVGGNWLLGSDCAGLVCYGILMFFEARYRRIHMADPAVVQAVQNGQT